MSLAEDIGKLNYEVRTFLDCVEEVTVYEGRIKNDPKYWEIKFNGISTPLKIEAEELDSSKSFRRKFLKLANTPAPPLSASEWYLVVKALSEKAKVGTYAEESDNVYIAETLFERIRKLTPIKKDLVFVAKGYVPHDGYRCVHNHTIKELMEGLNLKLPPNTLSTTLTQLGYKEESTKALWINGEQYRFWFFKEEHFSVSAGGTHE